MRSCQHDFDKKMRIYTLSSTHFTATIYIYSSYPVFSSVSYNKDEKILKKYWFFLKSYLQKGKIEL